MLINVLFISLRFRSISLPLHILRFLAVILSSVLAVIFCRNLLVYNFDSGILFYLHFVVAVFHQLERCLFVRHLIYSLYLISGIWFNFKLRFTIFVSFQSLAVSHFFTIQIGHSTVLFRRIKGDIIEDLFLFF